MNFIPCSCIYREPRYLSIKNRYIDGDKKLFQINCIGDQTVKLNPMTMIHINYFIQCLHRRALTTESDISSCYKNVSLTLTHSYISLIFSFRFFRNNKQNKTTKTKRVFDYNFCRKKTYFDEKSVLIKSHCC